MDFELSPKQCSSEKKKKKKTNTKGKKRSNYCTRKEVI